MPLDASLIVAAGSTRLKTEAGERVTKVTDTKASPDHTKRSTNALRHRTGPSRRRTTKSRYCEVRIAVTAADSWVSPRRATPASRNHLRNAISLIFVLGKLCSEILRFATESGSTHDARSLLYTGIVASNRWDGLRVSFHAYNTLDDVHTVIQALERNLDLAHLEGMR